MIRKTMMTGVVALGLSCAVALAEDERKENQPQQSNNQNQSDANTAASGGVKAEQTRDAAGGQSSGRDAELSRKFEAGADKDAGSAGQPGADAAQLAAAREDEAAMQDPTQWFIKEAYNANLFEIQAGQLAAQRVQDDKIKQFARMMVEDHTKANQQLKQLAQSSQFQVREQLDPIHQMKLQKMQKIPASEFGRKYVNGQVAGHWMSVLEYRYQAKNAQNAQVKQYASQTLPNLEKHLQHVQQLAEQQAGGAGEARTASERQPADAAPARQPGQPGQPQREGTDTTDRPERSNQPAEQPKAD
jgi:putative membrane protein